MKPLVLFTDSWSQGYYHWMCDCLPRLFVSLDIAKKYGIILPHSYKNQEYVNGSIKSYGIEKVIYTKPGGIHYFKKLIFPVHHAPTGNYNDLIIQQMRSFFKENITSDFSFGNKIYISREKAMRRKILNEDKVIECLAQYGFISVCLEDYPWEKQVQLFANAKYLIGLHGAGLSNLLFMNSNSNVLEFRKKGDAHNNCYFSLASALNINYYYQLCEVDQPEKPVLENNFFVDINLLNINLNLMLHV